MCAEHEVAAAFVTSSLLSTCCYRAATWPPVAVLPLAHHVYDAHHGHEPCSLAASTCQRLPLCPPALQACLILGYQFFDGEGCRNSREDALRCFKASAASGSKEAEEVLGWMFNTGQY